MPKRGNQPYTYKETDDPVTVANQFGITPTQLLAANPGGSPFVVGQNINIPFNYAPSPTLQYSAPIGPQPLQGPQPFTGPQPAPTPPVGYGPNASFPTPRITPTGYGTDDSWYRTPQQTASANAAMTNIQNGTTAVPAGGISTPVPGSGDFYGYERDPETGRSVRVVKNASTSNFLSELRWDPQARKYVSIGRLLKQGKLDLKGNWRKKSRRQRMTDNINRKKEQQQTQQQDFTLSNSLITFGASSG